MQTSLFIAKLIGPVLVVAGLTGALNPDALRKMAREFMDSPALIFIAGVMALLGGLVMVNTHNVWVADWPVILTVFGWIMIAAGIMRIGFPDLTKSLGRSMLANQNLLRAMAVLQVLLGAFLMYKGYG